MRLLYIYLLECSKWKPEGPKKIWISFWRCLDSELVSLGSIFRSRSLIQVLWRVFRWPTSEPGRAVGRDARRGAQGLPQRTLAMEGRRGRSQTGPRFHARFHALFQQVVSSPVSWVVSAAWFSGPGFMAGFMPGFMGHETKGWFQGSKKMCCHMYIYICMDTHIHVHVYIYIYREREICRIYTHMW